LVYLAHFVLGKDWASYQLINCFAVAGMAAATFQIARAVLELRVGSSVVAALMVVISPPPWESSVFGIAFAMDPLNTVLVASAFLAVFARRDLLCVALLFLALLTKENAVWAPLAAAITVMLRPKLDESLRSRAVTAGTMLLPVAMLLGLRFALFGGIGGTYATDGYTPLASFLAFTLTKLTHLHYLFVSHVFLGEWLDRGTARLIDRGTQVLFYALLFLWAIRTLPEVVKHVRDAVHEMRWPTVDAAFLVTLWAALALAFHFALPLVFERYATSIVVFVWPLLVAEIEWRGRTIFWLGLATLCALSMIRTSYGFFQWIGGPGLVSNETKSMNAVLSQAPTGTRQIYVLSAGGIQNANPEYVSPILGLSAQIVRVAEIEEKCGNARDFVAFDHSIADGVVSMTITLPDCANFYFRTDRFNSNLSRGRLYRNEWMSYELPEADPFNGRQWLFLGRRMTVHVRPNGPARFIIERSGPNGIAWFDTP
jgi:hypothetical protein